MTTTNKVLVLGLLVCSACTVELQPAPETVTTTMLEERLRVRDVEEAKFRQQVEKILNYLLEKDRDAEKKAR